MAQKITTTLLESLNTSVRGTFRTAYEGAQESEAWARKVASVVSSDSASNVYPYSIDPGPVREWTSGERVIRSIERGSFQIFNLPYEKTVGVKKWDIADDMTGTLMATTRETARKFAFHPDEMIAAIIAANPTCMDGKNLFHASHERNPAAPDGNTFSNIFASKPLSKENAMAVRAKMRSRKGPDGLVLRTNPRLLLVSPTLEATAIMICKAGFVPNAAGTATEENAFRGQFDYLVIDQLEDIAATTWYLADVSSEDRPFIIQEREPLHIETFFDPKDPEVFKRAEYVWGGSYRAGFGAGNPLRIGKCTA